MEIKIMLVKKNGTERTEAAFEELSEEERRTEGIRLKRRFFKILGYMEKSNPSA